MIRGKVSYERTEKEQNSALSRRSIFASKDIAEGEIFTEKNCAIVRPAYGLKPKYLMIYISRATKTLNRKSEITSCSLMKNVLRIR